jgi:hypothetical protein
VYPFVSHPCHVMDAQQKGHILVLLTGLLVLLTLSLSLGWLIDGRKNMKLRNMGVITLGLSLVLFFTTH